MNSYPDPSFFIIYALIDEDFDQPLLECPIDLRKLYTLINFNIYTRYEQLLEFFKMHSFLDEIKMVETKLNVIKHPMTSRSSDCNTSMNCSNSSLSTKIVKRKRIYNITTKINVPTGAVTEDEVSQSSSKHLKCD